LIKSLYERKETLIVQINEFFTTERKKIEEKENEWRQKQGMADNLLKISSNREDDQTILENSKYIADSLKLLSSTSKFERYELINSLDTVMHVSDDEGKIKKVDITHEELKRLISVYITPNEKKRVQYRC